MTIAVCAKVSEGLVLGADSLMIVEDIDSQMKKPIVANTFKNVKKLHQLEGYPIGILSWGTESIGPRNIVSLVDEFDHSLPDYNDNIDYTVEEISQSFFNFIKKKCEKINPERLKRFELGIAINGFSRGEFFPNEFKFTLPFSTKIEEVRPNDSNGNPSFGVSWYGRYDAIVRLHMGCDFGLRMEITEILLKKGMEIEEINKIFSEYEYSSNFSSMPLQDAINFVSYLINLMCGRCRFYSGTPFCGGPIDIAVITYKGFKWIKSKEWKV